MPRAVGTGTSWKRRVLLLLVIAAAVFGCGQWWNACALQPPSGNTPFAQLALANFYAKLGNWDAASSIFHRLEADFNARGDHRNALYAHVSRLQADIETLNLQRVSDELTAILARPEVQRNLALKQRCLEVKGNVDLNRDGLSARPSFKELERVAILRHDRDAASRASGELGVLAFLEGNSYEALKRVVGAWVKATLSGDVGAQIRYLSLLGQGMAQNHGPSEALLVLNRAISIAKHTPGAGFPKIAVSGCASAFTQLGQFTDAHRIIELGLEYARQRQYIGYQVDILAASGQLARAEGNEPYAIAQYEEAAALARVIHFNRGLAEVNAQLASLYRRAGNLQKAEESARECISAHREMGEVYQLPEHLAVEGEIEAAAGQIASAEHTFQTAERIVGTMLANTPTPGIKRAVISAMSDVFVAHFTLEIKQRDFAKAYDVIEEPRGRVAADRLWSDSRVSRQASAISDAERKLALLQMRLWDPGNDSDQEKLADSINGRREPTFASAAATS
jgi:tetratricopeptide (TPR) repeat protein